MEIKNESKQNSLSIEQQAVGVDSADLSKKASIDDLMKKIECKYPMPPSGLGRWTKPQKAPCTQWPWASQNKSSIPFATSANSNLHNTGTSDGSESPNNFLKYPWSHQHKSEAMDFVRSSPDPSSDNLQKLAQSMYKSDFASPNSLMESKTVFGRASNKSPVSLTGTNIRGNYNTSDRYDQQRWTCKVIDKKTPRTINGEDSLTQEKLELELISKLDIDQAYEKILKEKEESAMKDRQKRNPIC